MSVYVSIIIAYHLANSYKQDIPGAVSMALISFFIMTYQTKEGGGLDTTFFGPKGLFAAMFASIIAVELFRWCIRRNSLSRCQNQFLISYLDHLK